MVTGEADGKTLADLVALNIGQIGENLVLRRAAKFASNTQLQEGVKLAVITHPSASAASDNSNVVYGRYGVIMAYSKHKEIGILPENHTVCKYLN